MTELLTLYWPTLLAAAAAAAALSLVGAFVLTRHAGVQTLALSQGAGFGVSLGLIVSQLWGHGHLQHTALPLVTGLLAAALSFAATERAARRSHSPTGVYIASFALLWSATQWLTGYFPVIESHATSIYFGDIVTLTREESFFFLALGLGTLLYLAATWRRQAERAFLASILNEPLLLRRGADLGFYAATLLLLSLAVQLLGLLFTLSCLFLPTALYSYSRRPGARRHLWRVSVAAATAALAGFLLSLANDRFLTTPTIALLLGLLPATHLLAERLKNRCK